MFKLSFKVEIYPSVTYCVIKFKAYAWKVFDSSLARKLKFSDETDNHKAQHNWLLSLTVSANMLRAGGL